ncbi:MAG: SbcC/MukB-like Walker B domain-containing protein, partial [Bacilli bacterium]
EDFGRQRKGFQDLCETVADAEARVQNELNETNVFFLQGRKEYEQLTAEIKGLKSRRSNISEKQIAMRRGLCQALGLEEEEMPFAGELLQVREEEKDWEGAIERLLHSFGLSLLVPDSHYARVAQWVDQTHLKGRLVYFRVRENLPSRGAVEHPHSLARKVAIKADSSFFSWMEREIVHRFDLVCCTTQEAFRREGKAITMAGQIKMPGGRHEKDDRHRIDDRSRYVLGWSNAAKIAALEAKARGEETRLAEIAGRIATLQGEQKGCKARLATLSKIDVYADFWELDWKPVALAISTLQAERKALETASNVLQTLTRQLEALLVEQKKTLKVLDTAKDKRSKTEQKIDHVEKLQLETRALLPQADTGYSERFAVLETIREEALGNCQLTVDSCDNRERDMRDWLQKKIDGEDGKLKRLGEKIVKAMSEYRQQWPLETREVDAAIDAGFEYRAMLTQLLADDLPRFEEQFKKLLNENTIREVVQFQSYLNQEREIIRERVGKINDSLTRIDYNPDRYIGLEAQTSPDADIREFQQDLLACSEGALTGSDDIQYSESKFLYVRRIIDRFRGRPDHADIDRRWTERVTDVRNWFVFAASERWREDDIEYEHYADSGGKSGGQKEKLAYTVLAASLAYQFGLEWGAVRSRTFRFVVIDEAFGRGSDESARYGLELFAQLNLQLLIVTPLQKIHIIEPFVSSVGFVHNEEGRNSVLRNLSIEEYRAEKQRMQQ